jgi:hypothetical protein
MTIDSTATLVLPNEGYDLSRCYDEVDHTVVIYACDHSVLTYVISTRHVIAGLATALAGLLGPDGYYSPLHNRIISGALISPLTSTFVLLMIR